MWRSPLNTRFKEAIMKQYHRLIKELLNKCILETKQVSDLYVRSPGKDFSRKRKLDFCEVIKIILSMGGNTLSKELLEYYDYSEDVVSSSAFVQQRDKVLPEAFGFLLNHFTSALPRLKRFKNYRLLAVDGTGVTIARNRSDRTTYVESKDHNLLHITAIYDLVNKIYTDIEIQPVKEKSEFRAVVQMVDRSTITDKSILIGDRGYESYNVFAHAQAKGWKYLIRVRSPIKRGAILSNLDLKEDECFDEDIQIKLTRHQTRDILRRKKEYRLISKDQTFDYLAPQSKSSYVLNYRVVCIKTKSGKFQYLVTNLSRDEFSKDDIRKLYEMRWGIETSFRELKYAIGMMNFHSKKVDLVKQEIYARTIMYNFCEAITLSIVLKQDKRKHLYQVNFTMAIHICKHYFIGFKDPPDLVALLKRYILPVRSDRNYPRKIFTRSRISYLYRIA